jgi:acyl carrier protein
MKTTCTTTSAMNVAQIGKDIRAHIVEWLLSPDEAAVLQDSDDLHPLLSSLRVLSLVLHIERTYHIKVEDSDLNAENFATIERIAAYVARRLDPSASGE